MKSSKPVKHHKPSKYPSRKRDASESPAHPAKKAKTDSKKAKEHKEYKEKDTPSKDKKKVSYSLFDEDSPLENINNFQVLPVNSEKIYDLNHDLKFQRQLRLIQLSNAHLSSMEHPSFNDHEMSANTNNDDDDSASITTDDSLDLDLDFDLDFDFSDRAITLVSDIDTPTSPHLNDKFTVSIPIIDDTPQTPTNASDNSTALNTNTPTIDTIFANNTTSNNNNILLSPSSSFNMLNLSGRSNMLSKKLNQSNNSQPEPISSSSTTPTPIVLSEFLNIDQSTHQQQQLQQPSPQKSTNTFEYRHNNRNINLALTKDLNCRIDPCKRALNRLAIWSGKAHEMVLNSTLPIDEFIII